MSDARNLNDERLGEERILETIRANRDAAPADILERVMAVLDAHTDGASRRDDLTIVLLRA